MSWLSGVHGQRHDEYTRQRLADMRREHKARGTECTVANKAAWGKSILSIVCGLIARACLSDVPNGPTRRQRPGGHRIVPDVLRALKQGVSDGLMHAPCYSIESNPTAA
jgi:hypothetical protein